MYMFTMEKTDRKVADELEKCVNGNSCKYVNELTSTELEAVLHANRIVSMKMVSTKSIKNVCSLRRTSK